MLLPLSLLSIFATTLHAQNSTAWPEADKLFHSDPNFIGADAAFSVDLGHDRVLWLFGDTFIPRDPQHPSRRTNFFFLHNSLAIQHGYDPSQASIHFYWPTQKHQPTEQFPNEHDIWIWLGSGTRVGNALWIFASRITSDHSKNSLGFKGVGWNAYLITNPDSDPSQWHPRKVMQRNENFVLGVSFLREGDYVYLFGEASPGGDLYVARQSVATMSAGKLGNLQWWNGHDWQGTAATRKPIMPEAGSEFSVQRDPTGNGYLEFNTQGFGAADIIMRRASSITGPWSAPQVVYHPPESDKPDPFVYAGKSHPELRGADLILTYVPSSFKESNADDFTRYFPRFVRITLPPRGHIQ